MTLSEIDFGKMFEAHLDGGPAIADFHATTVSVNSQGEPIKPQHIVELTWQLKPGKMSDVLESAVCDFNSQVGGTELAPGESDPLKVVEARVVGDKAVFSEVFTPNEIVSILGKAISLHSYSN